MSETSVGHMPEGKWEFGQAVTDVFDDMLERSIPAYKLMRELCFSVGCHFVRHQTAVVDLGCSRGGALAQFVDQYGAFNRYVGVEVSQPMLAAARERFAGLISTGVVTIKDMDLRLDYPPELASLTLCVLTLQFTPIEVRQQILANVYKHTIPGGALLLVEKVLGQGADIDNLFVDEYYRKKGEGGYSPEEIARKRLALSGVLVPITDRMNQQLLKDAGFSQVECFWRVLNFAGYLAVK